ncbi:hypothetical protein Plhal304r1_c005g0019111 [Plasmopara halstedii]
MSWRTEEQWRRPYGASRQIVADTQEGRAINYNIHAQNYRRPYMTSETQFNDLSTSYSRVRNVSRTSQVEMNWHDGRYEMETLCNPEEETQGKRSGLSKPFFEAQHLSDIASLSTTNHDGETERENSCRVTWCKLTRKRYGLCWAHGGVQKCCHRNCSKIATDTSDFCSIHILHRTHSR